MARAPAGIETRRSLLVYRKEHSDESYLCVIPSSTIEHKLLFPLLNHTVFSTKLSNKPKTEQAWVLYFCNVWRFKLKVYIITTLFSLLWMSVTLLHQRSSSYIQTYTFIYRWLKRIMKKRGDLGHATFTNTRNKFLLWANWQLRGETKHYKNSLKQ